MDLALNNQQRLICYKTQPTNHPKVNIIAWLEFELAYCDVTVQPVSHSDTRTHLLYIYICIYMYFFLFIIQRVKARAIPSPHQSLTRGDNTVSLTRGGTATPGATKQLLPPDRVLRELYIYIYIYIYCITRI